MDFTPIKVEHVCASNTAPTVVSGLCEGRKLMARWVETQVHAENKHLPSGASQNLQTGFFNRDTAPPKRGDGLRA